MDKKEFYTFEIDNKEYLFDEEKFYNWNESIKDLHLIQYSSKESTLNFLCCEKENHFLDFCGRDLLADFLINNGVQLQAFNFHSFQVNLKVEIKFLTDEGSSELNLYGGEARSCYLNLFKNKKQIASYPISVKQVKKLDFNQTLEKTVKLKKKELLDNVPTFKADDTSDGCLHNFVLLVGFLGLIMWVLAQCS